MLGFLLPGVDHRLNNANSFIRVLLPFATELSAPAPRTIIEGASLNYLPLVSRNSCIGERPYTWVLHQCHHWQTPAKTRK